MSISTNVHQYNREYSSPYLSFTCYACHTRQPKPQPQAMSLYGPRKPSPQPKNITGEWYDSPSIGQKAEPVDSDRMYHACRNIFVGHFDSRNLLSAKEREISDNAQRHYRNIETLKISAEEGCHLCSLLASSVQKKPGISRKREIGIVYGVDAGIRFGYVQVCFYSLCGENDSEVKECFSIVATPRRSQFCAVSSGLD